MTDPIKFPITQNPDGSFEAVAFQPILQPASKPEPAPPPPPAEKPKITHQTLSVEPSTIHVGETFTITGTLHYNDGSTQPVTAYRVGSLDKSIARKVSTWGQDFTALKEGTCTIRNDNSNTRAELEITVLAASGNEDPTDPPDDGADPNPPPTDPPDTPPDLPPGKNGEHTTRAISIDRVTGVIWEAQALVGEDYKAPATVAALMNANGESHPSLRLYAYADCAEVGAVNGRDPYDYVGSLRIDYDDENVYDAHEVEFPRGVFNKTIRYGTHQPTWNPVDRGLFPNYASSDQPLALTDLSRYDWSYNGMGCAGYRSMGTAGMRPDIAFVPGWDVPFIVQPSDATYAIVRKVADQSGAWPIYFLDDDTAQPFDITDYPDTSFLTAMQIKMDTNPIAMYQNKKQWAITGSKLTWDCAHETGYNIVAAAATMSGRDRFHVGVWANAVLTASNPWTRQNKGVFGGYQERATAWSLRSLFAAAHLSDRPTYFKERLEEQRLLGEKQITHPMGAQGTYVTRRLVKSDTWGQAPWEENYTRLVVGVIAKQNPEWKTLNDRLKRWNAILDQPWWQLSTNYIFALEDAKKEPLTTWADILTATLKGKWSDEDILNVLDETTTADEVTQLIQKYQPDWNGAVGDFNENYLASPQGYGAIQLASIATMEGDGDRYDKCRAGARRYTFRSNWAWNIVPDER